MDNESMKLIYEGKDLLFTFKDEAEKFIKQHHLKVKLVEDSLIEEEHYQVKGYKSKLYWIVR